MLEYLQIFSVGTLRTKFSHTAKFVFYFVAEFDPTPTFAGAYIMTIQFLFLCILMTRNLAALHLVNASNQVTGVESLFFVQFQLNFAWGSSFFTEICPCGTGTDTHVPQNVFLVFLVQFGLPQAGAVRIVSDTLVIFIVIGWGGGPPVLDPQLICDATAITAWSRRRR